MQALASTILLAATVTAIAGASPLQAQDIQQQREAEACRLGLLHPFVGAWNETLDVIGVGTSMSLISINQGGTLTESDGIDFLDPTRPSSPRYGVWRALDCEHYVVTQERVVYVNTTKQFQRTILRGTALLSPDHNSWTASLTQQIQDANGTVVGTDSITGSATRIEPQASF